MTFFVCGICLDQTTKIWARDELSNGSHYIGSTHIGFSLTTNSGSAFSLFQGSTMALTIVATIAVAALLIATFRKRVTFTAVTYVAIATGATGNLIDRFTQPPHGGSGHVTDFIRVGSWPTFNIADAFVVCGAVALVVHTFLQSKPQTESEIKS